MRIWFIGLMFAAAAAWIAGDPDRARWAGTVARQAPGRLLLASGDSPSLAARVAASARRSLEAAAYEDLPVETRTGLSEIGWLGTTLSGDELLGDGFAGAYATVMDAALDLPGEPALLALATDALRAHRAAVGRAEAATARERALAAELIRLGRERDPDNGLFALFGAEVALLEGRVEECCDLLLIAARAERVDAYRVERWTAAERTLVERGADPLEAREFLLEHLGGGEDGVGAMLERIGVDLARRVEGLSEADRLRAWCSIFEIGVLASQAALTVEDALAALAAETQYRQRTRVPWAGAARPGMARLDPLLIEGLRRVGLDGALPEIARLEHKSRMLRAALEHPRRRAGLRLRATRDATLLSLGHGLLVPLIALSLALGIAFLLVRVPMRRVERPRSAPTGLYVAATASPGLLILYLAARGFWPFTARPVLERALEAPGPALLAVPLCAMLVFALPCLSDRRLRAPRVFTGEIARLNLFLAAVLALVFAVTADDVVKRRKDRMEALAQHVVETHLAGEAASG